MVVDAVMSHRGGQSEPAVPPDREHGARKRAAVHFGPEIGHRGGEPRAVEAERGRRRGRDAGARGQRHACAARRDEAGERREGARPHGCASEIVSPKPIGYSGGMRIGRWPVIGTLPSKASATARSAARTPLHAIR